MMKMRNDPDLEFLGGCKSKQLNPLVEVLTLGNQGIERVTTTLTVTDEWKAHNPKHKKYWRLVAAELQYFGADSLMTLVRGNKGVPYREILTDVCGRLDVNYKNDSPTELIETNLLMKVGMDIFEDMTPDQLQEVADEIGVEWPSGGAAVATATLLLQIILRHGAFYTYQLALIVSNAVAQAVIGRGLSFVANTLLVKSIYRFINWPVAALLTVPLVTGPAYRVTIPAVFQVIALRRLRLAEEQQAA